MTDWNQPPAGPPQQPYPQQPYPQQQYPQQPVGAPPRSGVSAKKPLIVVGGVVAAVAVLLGGYVLWSRPSTVSEREFAAGACGVLKPWSKKIQDQVLDNQEMLNNFGGDEMSRRDAETGREFLLDLFSLTQESVGEMRDYVDDHVIDHEDGEAFREELLAEYDEAIDTIDDARSDLEDLDVSTSDGVDEFSRWVAEDGGYGKINIEVKGSLSELAADIDERMADLDDRYCSAGFAG